MGRDTSVLTPLSALGAGVVFSFSRDSKAVEHGFQACFCEGMDVVLNYLWGASAQSLRATAAKAGPEAEKLWSSTEPIFVVETPITWPSEPVLSTLAWNHLFVATCST